MSERKLRIAWFSVLGDRGRVQGCDVLSKSAYASDLVLPYLKRHFEIEVFQDNFEAYRDLRSAHYLSAFLRDQEAPFDLYFYQVEDHRSARFVRMHLGLQPGVVWFHDFAFSDPGADPILNSGWKKIVEKFHRSEVAWPNPKDEHRQFRPYAMRESAYSIVSLFSSVRDHSEFKRLADAGLFKNLNLRAPHSHYVPLPVQAEDFFPFARIAPEIEQCMVLAYAGSPRVEDRSHKILEALSRFGQPYKLLWLIDHSEREQAQELLTEYSINSVDLVLGRTARAWGEMLKECHLALHLHFSAFGQLGPYLNMSMAHAVPAVVNQYFGTEHISENLAYKIEPGAQEANALRELLLTLRSRTDWEKVGALSKEFASEYFQARVVAAELASVIRNSALLLRGIGNSWSEFRNLSQQVLLQSAADCLLPHEPWLRGFEAYDNQHFGSLGPAFQDLEWK